jgi:hypothetical protein
MEKPIVFLSHSSLDKPQLVALKTLLDERAAGALELFLSSDGQSIRLGANWVARISDALAKAKLMFVFLSPRSVDSKWIHFEAGHAYAKGVQVVPVCLPGMELRKVAQPLNLLQGFNLHSYETLANLARVCNDSFSMKIDETFTKEDFNLVFAGSRGQMRGLFGGHSWAVEKVTFHSKVELPERDAFNPFPQLQKACSSAGVRIMSFEETKADQQPRWQIDLPGCSMSAYQQVLETGPGLSRLTALYLSGDLSPSLFHLNARALDEWFNLAAFPAPWAASLHFVPEIVHETERHQLTTKLLNSDVLLSGGPKLRFEELVFELSQLGGVTIAIECRGHLQDPRWGHLIDRLFELKVLAEDASAAQRRDEDRSALLRGLRFS